MWDLVCVRPSFSDNSMINFVSTLLGMSPGVGNEKKLALGKDGIECYVNYWMLNLNVEENNSPFTVICFDESLNKNPLKIES